MELKVQEKSGAVLFTEIRKIRRDIRKTRHPKVVLVTSSTKNPELKLWVEPQVQKLQQHLKYTEQLHEADVFRRVAFIRVTHEQITNNL